MTSQFASDNMNVSGEVILKMLRNFKFNQNLLFHVIWYTLRCHDGGFIIPSTWNPENDLQWTTKKGEGEQITNYMRHSWDVLSPFLSPYALINGKAYKTQFVHQ